MPAMSGQVRREGTLNGGYILQTAAAELGDGVRVVSMPCMDVFNRQSQEYKDEV